MPDSIMSLYADPHTQDLFRKLNVSRESQERLRVYVALLRQWQTRINLVGPGTLDQIWQRHIADALQVLPLMKMEKSYFADLGSGAGIPGLVVAIAGNYPVSLYESNGKKCAFLREAARVTGTNAQIHQTRLEALPPIAPQDTPHYITARALAPLPVLLDWASVFLKVGAVGLFHKGQDVDRELTEAAKSWSMDVIKHPSLIDSSGVILEIRNLSRI